MSTPRPIPAIDEQSRPYWDAAREHRLLLQRCSGCDRYVFGARAVCPGCHASSLEWVPASGGGVVYSFTVVWRAASEAFVAPYVVALVDLDEGPRMLSTLRVADPGMAAIGARVRVAFEELDEVTLPVFELA